jgi:hypothetical protein
VPSITRVSGKVGRDLFKASEMTVIKTNIRRTVLR